MAQCHLFFPLPTVLQPASVTGIGKAGPFCAGVAAFGALAILGISSSNQPWVEMPMVLNALINVHLNTGNILPSVIRMHGCITLHRIYTVH
jgi:hypothetical protein